MNIPSRESAWIYEARCSPPTSEEVQDVLWSEFSGVGLWLLGEWVDMNLEYLTPWNYKCLVCSWKIGPRFAPPKKKPVWIAAFFRCYNVTYCWPRPKPPTLATNQLFDRKLVNYSNVCLGRFLPQKLGTVRFFCNFLLVVSFFFFLRNNGAANASGVRSFGVLGCPRKIVNG